MPPSLIEQSNTVTVFVRNLSFNVDDKTLSDAFAHIGPVKEAFVLKDKNKKL